MTECDKRKSWRVRDERVMDACWSCPGHRQKRLEQDRVRVERRLRWLNSDDPPYGEAFLIKNLQTIVWAIPEEHFQEFCGLLKQESCRKLQEVLAD